MPAELLLALPALVPLGLAALLAVRPLARGASLLAPLGALPALAVALAAPDGRADLPWLLLGTRLRLDDPSRTFLLLAGAVWLAAGVHALSYLREDPRRPAFLAWWSVALAGNAGLVLAGDAASFYLCFAAMSFASYALVVHDRTDGAVRAGRVYLALVVVGEVFVFAALALGAHAAGSLLLADVARATAASPWRDALVLCALVGFGAKAGVVGVHVWLPLAHPEAPTPASAVLSGVMVKAALVGWLGVLPAAALPGWGAAFLVLGIAGAFFGVLVGLTQRHPKAILAYSTVSQMGIATAGVGAALTDPSLRTAALAALPLFALHHGIAKGALFLGTGVAKTAGRFRRLAAASLALPALQLAAAPLTSGAVAKGAVKGLVSASGAGGVVAPVLLAVSSAGTALLLAHLLRVLHASPEDPHAHPPRWGETVPYLALAALSLALPALMGAVPELDGKGLWPLALGIAAAAAFWSFPAPPIPPGDVLAVYAGIGRRASLSFAVARPPPERSAGGWLARAGAWARGAEDRLGREGGRGFAFVALVAALHLLVLLG
jgi:formate hydrogenlyase subunit 3/multisubunit Na+/H+ antiporter MnhD subunit